MEVAQLLEERKRLDCDLLFLIARRLNEFEGTTGVRVKGISLTMTDVTTRGDAQPHNILTSVRTELAI